MPVSLMKTLDHPPAPPLPARISDWVRVLKKERSINDMVEDIHRVLVEDDTYRKYLRAVYKEQAVEGSLIVDDVMAAQMILAKARAIGSEVAEENITTIVKSLRTTLRRYGLSRKQRRKIVVSETQVGETVSSENTGE